jgi:hypothetical protein
MGHAISAAHGLLVKLRLGDGETVHRDDPLGGVLEESLGFRGVDFAAGLCDPLRRLEAVDPLAQTLAAVGLADVPDDRWFGWVDVHKLLPLVLLDVDPRDIPPGQNLTRPLDGAGEAVARARSYQRIVVVRRDEVGDSNAIDSVGITIVLTGVAGFYEVTELAGAVLDLFPDNLDRDGGLHAIPVRVDEHFEDLVAGIDGPGRIVFGGDHLRVRLLVLVGVEATFVWRKGLDELHRPDSGRNFFGVGKIHDGRRHRPELRQIASDLKVKCDGGGVDEIDIDFPGHIDETNLNDRHMHLLNEASRGRRQAPRATLAVRLCDVGLPSKG